MTKLKCWKKTGISKTSIWWKNGDQNVNVTDIPQTEQWFAFIDPGKKFKARTEIARNKKEATKYAKAYMKEHNNC